ncbi:DUF4041 domain-containing protein [bacterium]|nr:DUF4041 domain-containing protein [bacterium]
MALILFLVSVGLVIYLLTVRQNASKEQARLKDQLDTMAALNATLEAENQTLGKYRVIIDAEAEAQRIVGEAKDMAFEIEDDAKGIRAQANQALNDARGRLESTMRSAQQEAQTIIDNANKRAEEIAGSAYEAVRNADRFEKVAKAMRNVIEGYGDQYVIPSHSLLDDLADDYAFTEAGEELKNARERVRLMVKGNTAATCEYVETNRRDTAIRFVVDAFNGKVDSILSRTKSDNFGKLEQEIKDAFNLVNHNGAAFRNARILDSFLDARLTELRWAATVQEIKLRDREEQRRIKEQIREEERAQREFERALKEAAKEEETLRKAMEKIQAQVEKASSAQREKYEAQLAEMAEKLRQAEEKNQRALSMAQQTKTGHVYVISNIGSFGEDVYKIGLTRRLEPLDRVRELGDASVPFSFDVHAMIYSEDAPALETALHRHFLAAQVNKVNPRKEFFRVPIAALREELESLGVKAQWTLQAEAKEYRETLVIERALTEDPEKGRHWLESQAQYDASGEFAREEIEA